MLQLDFSRCHASRVGPEHGLTDEEIHAIDAELRPACATLAAGGDFGGQRWRGLVREPVRTAHLTAIEAAAAPWRNRARNLIVLGIGGSALGNIALQSALNPPTWNLMSDEQRAGPRLFVLDNVDPSTVGATLDLIEADDPGFENTVVNVVSKSGETAETAAQFMVLRDRLQTARGAAAREHIIAVTDPSHGTMRTICDQEGYTTLPVPEGVGGRFSVLSPVGLFSAAMCGIDIAALLDGAAAMDDACKNTAPQENPAAQLAGTLIGLTRKGKPIHVLMPYANALYLLADWYRQIWAESLGKRYDRDGNEVWAGPTPVKALGTTDQHSQVQLYREGPNDKVIGFMEVDDFGRDVTIPRGFGVETLGYLEGSTLGTLLTAEKKATEYALLDSRRPSYTIGFPRIDALHVGAFIQLWQLATAVAGEMLNIDAFDQPAVETGKKATFGLMGRPGYEEWKEKVAGTSRV